jgi:plasmid replication initiation protein
LIAELERNVLKLAKENINKHSDIQIEYRVKRKAKTPVSIAFKARYKNKSDKLKNLQPENFELVKEIETPQEKETNDLPMQDKGVAKKWLEKI